MKLHKRIVTVLYREIGVADIHPGLAKVQWIDFCKHGTDFLTKFGELTRTLDSDPDYVRSHTRGRSRGGATRSQYSQIDSKNLIALVPNSTEGLTTQQYPQFWFYLPFGGSSQSPPAKFRLLNEQKKSVLTKPLLLSLPEKKGIASISLPSIEKPLSTGQRYHWYFNITCVNNKGLNTKISVDVWIKRVEATSGLVQRIKEIGHQQQYVPYAENSIWYETISQLAKSRIAYQQEWTKLLSLFKLEEFANSPIYELKLQTDIPHQEPKANASKY